MSTKGKFVEFVKRCYEQNRPFSLDEYCRALEDTIEISDFRKFIEKKGLQHDLATRVNWNYRYECFKNEAEKESSNFLDESREFLKICYDKGVVIEYEEVEDKWVDLPRGLPIDFSKLDEGKIRLKSSDPRTNNTI